MNLLKLRQLRRCILDAEPALRKRTNRTIPAYLPVVRPLSTAPVMPSIKIFHLEMEGAAFETRVLVLAQLEKLLLLLFKEVDKE